MKEADRQSFENHLKKSGKKPHVVQGLLRQVDQFEQFLNTMGKGLDSASRRDIQEYADRLESSQAGSAPKGVRGLALYFRFTGQAALAEAASSLREAGIAGHRHVFRLEDFRGVNPEHVNRLKADGITNVEQMLMAGKTEAQRRELAARTQVPLTAILELVKLSDLSRLPGVKTIRARLYYDAGLDTVEKLAGCEPEELLRLTSEFVARTGFDGIPPLPKEVLSTIRTACQLPRVIEY